jgi:hypothetical protein
MIEFPPYMRLVVDNTVKRPNSVRNQGDKPKVQASSSASSGDVVELVSTENRRATYTDVPTALEAEAALRHLQRDLPRLSSDQAGEIHSGLDRRVILSLLAPLMEA